MYFKILPPRPGSPAAKLFPLVTKTTIADPDLFERRIPAILDEVRRDRRR